jgi:hypothetical protein
MTWEANVKEDIKAAIERAAKQYDARAGAAKQQRDKELIERQQFEAGYRRKRDDVILLAIGALTKILEPHEWTCKIIDGEAASIKFEVFRGNMKGASTAPPIHKLQRRRWLDASNDLDGYANSSGSENDVPTRRTH